MSSFTASLVTAVLGAFVPSHPSADGLIGALRFSGSTSLGRERQILSVRGAEVARERRTAATADVHAFVLPILALGLSLRYEGVGQRYRDLGEDRLDQLLVGPSLLLLFPVSDRFAFAGELSLLHTRATFAPSGLTTQHASGWGYGMSGGASYFVVAGFSVDLRLGWQDVRVSMDDGPGPAQRVVGRTMTIGFSVYLRDPRLRGRHRSTGASPEW